MGGCDIVEIAPNGLNHEERRRDTVKSTGIVRKVDELGRIVLPIELRRTLDISNRDALEICVEGSAVVLRKFRPTCVFCDGAKDVRVFKGKNICGRCFKELRSE